VKMLCCNSFEQWREEYMHRMMKVDFKPFNAIPFSISFHFLLGLPGVVNGRFSAGTFVRTSEHIKGEEDAFQLTNPEIGGVHYEQGGRQVQLRRGEAILIDGAKPCCFGSPNGFGGLGIMVPRAEFESRSVRPDNLAMQRLGAPCEALGLLKSYVRLLEKSKLASTDAFGVSTALREVSQRHIYDLVAVAVSWCGAVGESELNAVVDARLRMAIDYISAHFGDPQLTVEKVAQEQGISARYLQRLMKFSGHSYTAMVNEMRLQKAFAELTAATQRGRSVLDIAMQVGFSDISHFNRLFRARFADTPSGVRAQACRISK